MIKKMPAIIERFIEERIEGNNFSVLPSILKSNIYMDQYYLGKYHLTFFLSPNYDIEIFVLNLSTGLKYYHVFSISQDLIKKIKEKSLNYVDLELECGIVFQDIQDSLSKYLNKK